MSDDDQAKIRLEQYKLYVEVADRLRDRRDRVHTYFVGLNTAGLGVLAFVVSLAEKGSAPTSWNAAALLSLVLWLVINSPWFLMLLVHRRTAALKGKVINELEKSLPSRPWTDEHLAKRDWLDFTLIELSFPVLFGIPFLIAFYWLCK
jgi:hypothetical protein